MLRKFLDLFTEQVEKEASTDTTVEMATAALMYEVVHADASVDTLEEDKVRGLLREHFSIDSAALDALTQAGAENAREAVDLVQFTRVLNDHYTAEQRTDILQKLWTVAFADQNLDKHEEHIIRRIADLMHIPHSLFIQSKLNAQDNQ